MDEDNASPQTVKETRSVDFTLVSAGTHASRLGTNCSKTISLQQWRKDVAFVSPTNYEQRIPKVDH